MATTYAVIEFPPEGGQNEKGERHYTRHFQVTSSNPLDGPAKITRQIDYLQYEAYPYAGEEDPAAILKDIDVRPTETLGVWMVDFRYDSASNEVDKGATSPSANGEPRPGTTPEKAGQGSQDKPPDQRPWTIKWGAVKATKILSRDYSQDGPEVQVGLVRVRQGKPVVNSAGQPFDPPLETAEAHPTLNVTFYSAQADPLNIRDFIDTVNDRPFMGWKKDRVRCIDYQITSQYEQGRFYWQIDVQLEIKPDGWNPVKVLDCGTMERYKPNDPLEKLRVINDAVTGHPVSSPVPLNGFGHHLELKNDEHGNPPAFVYLEFQGYRRANFRNLFNQRRKRKKKELIP